MFSSFILWPKFNEPNAINRLVKHVTELEKPEIVNRYFSIHFQHRRVEHHHLPNRYLVPNHVTVFILSPLWIEGCHKHYGTSFGICWDFDLSIFIGDFTVLRKFMEFHCSLIVVYEFYVLLNFFLVVADVVFQGKMNETMWHWSLSQDKFKLAVGIQLD